MLLAFLSVTITLLIAICICCYLIKYLAQQKIYYHFWTENKNKSILIIYIENE